MYTLLIILHLLVSILLITVVLLQSGKSADLAGAFGGYGSQSSFGPRGMATFMSKFTTVLAILFMVITLTLMIMSKNQVKESAANSASAVGKYNVLVIDSETKAPIKDAVVKYYQGDSTRAEATDKDAQDTKKAVSEYNKKITDEKGIAVIDSIVAKKPIFFTIEAKDYKQQVLEIKEFYKNKPIEFKMTKLNAPKKDETKVETKKPVEKKVEDVKPKPEDKTKAEDKKDSKTDSTKKAESKENNKK